MKMRPSSMQINVNVIITVLIFLLLQIVTVLSQCSVKNSLDCDPEGIVNYSVTFKNNDGDLDFYEATVIFHWGGSDDYQLGPSSYTPYVDHTKTDSHYYLEDGEYYVGYTVEFGDDVRCNRKTYTSYKKVWFRNGSCDFEDVEGTNVPTQIESTDPPSPSPIVVTPAPIRITAAPTNRIITQAPTKRITPAPTWAAEPTATTPPPFIDINPIPTPSPITSGEETGTEKTLSPTINVERPTTTNSPTPGEGPSSGVIITTRPPVILMYNKNVQSTMILIHSNMMDLTATDIWKDVTETTIKNEVVDITKDSIDAKDVKVAIDIIKQHEIESIEAAGNRRRRRDLQNRDDGTLEIQYTTTIEFPQVGTYIYDPNQLIEAGFNSAEKEEAYIAELQREGSPTYFTEVNDIILTVDGKVVEYPNDDNDPPIDDPDGVEKPDDNDKGEGNNSLVPIVAGVVGGVVVLLAIILGVYYTKKRQAKLKEGKIDSHTTQDTVDKQQQQQQQQQQYNVAGVTKAIPGTESETKSAPSVNLPEEGGGDFGVIETAGFDDVSTIGDPYMGDAVAPVIDSDNTVGESTMQSAQQEYYGVGGKRVPTGIDSIMSSRFGGSTIGSNRMMFSDDPTLEDVYATPDGNLTTSQEDNVSTSFQRITVIAPAGMLGIVLDNPNGDLPVVYAIKETSALNGKVRVGDLLLNVDEIDCRGMSAHQISSFLSSRSKNPVRRLVLARSTKK